MRFHYTGAKAFTLIEIMIVVAILGVILTMVFPSLARARKDAQRNVCIENLTQIESAKQVCGIETGKKDGDPVTEVQLIGPSLYIREMPKCPAGGVYDFKAIGVNATCQPFGVSDGHILD